MSEIEGMALESVLAKAFVAAQRQFKGAKLLGTNPHFKSKYARYSDVHDACIGALHANGFALVQSGEGSDDAGIQITTTLIHECGASLKTTIRVPLSTSTAQAAGSAITYARRYGLAMACGLVNDEDDDGNGAMGEKPARKPPAATQTPSEKSKGLTLPGKPTSWDGFGGQPLSVVPVKALVAFAKWCREDAQRTKKYAKELEEAEYRAADADPTSSETPEPMENPFS